MNIKIFLIVILLLAILISWIAFYAIKCKNPYKLIMIFGKKGSGKSTFIAKRAYQCVKAGKVVYSTIDLNIAGVRKFNVEDLGFFTPPAGSVIFIDEVGIIWDNRNYKNFKPEVRDWFKFQRHYKVTVYLFSQTFDIDVKLRNLTDEMYLLRSHFGFISTCRKIARNITIVQATAESESRIVDNLEFVPIWTALFGGKPIIFTFIPHWTTLFDSYETPNLPKLNFSETQSTAKDFRPRYYGRLFWLHTWKRWRSFVRKIVYKSPFSKIHK